MLKGIVNGSPTDITRIPMKTRNLFTKSGSTDNTYIGGDGRLISNSSYSVSDYIPVSPLQNYTISPVSTQSTSACHAYYKSDKTLISTIVGSMSNQVLNTPENTAFIRVSWRSATVSDIMLNSGSTPLPYEPYGMQEGWEVRDQQGNILWGATKTLTGTDSISFKGYGPPIVSVEVEGNMSQSGTPSPSSIIVPQETGDLANLWDGENTLELPDIGTRYGFYCDAGVYSVRNDSGNIVYKFWNGGISRASVAQAHSTATFTISNEAPTGIFMPYNEGSTSGITIVKGSNIPAQQIPYGTVQIPLTLAGQTTPVYLQEPIRKIGEYADSASSDGTVTRRVKKLVLTGTEQMWNKSTSYPGGYYFAWESLGINGTRGMQFICSHARYVDQLSDYINGTCFSDGSCNIRIMESNSTLEDWKTYLAQQYAAGTPVTVWYVLATPVTEQITFPTLPTPVTGTNTLTVDTSLPPSKTKITVHAKKVHFGFKIDKTNDNSDTAVTYTHDALTMTPAAMDYTNGVFNYGSWENVWFVKDAYPAALNLDGTEAYRLDPDDYTKKSDGTPSDIQYVLLTEEPADWSTQWKQYYHKDANDNYVLNSDAEAPTFATDTYYQLTAGNFAGNFMIAFPKVYFKRTEDATYNYVEISNAKLGDDWYAYAHVNANGDEVDYIYLPMFKGSIISSKLRSIPGQIPQGGTTASAEVTAATACGSRWQIWDHSSRELINDLLVLMCKSIDSQGKFGKGRESGYNASDTVTYGKLQTGTLISKGKFFGYNTSYSNVKVFGIEGFWANRFDRIQGLLLVDNVWKVKMTPAYDFTGTNFQTLSTAAVPDGNGYLSKTQTSQYGSIPASVSGGSSSKYYKDYFYKTATGTRVALVGGYCSGGAPCGFRYVYVYTPASNTHWSIGASPIYK